MISLITTIYPIRSPERLKEISFCMEQNIANPLIDKIYVFAENLNEISSEYSFLNDHKVRIVPTKTRPTYKEFFNFANYHFTDSLVAICNSDVYFDGTLSHAAALKVGQLWNLCRYNVLENGQLELQHQGKQGSADAWVFRTPLKDFESNIEIGVLGCDSYLAQKAAMAGIENKNPCYTVILRHLHRSMERNDRPQGKCYWDEPDYAYYCVAPCR